MKCAWLSVVLSSVAGVVDAKSSAGWHYEVVDTAGMDDALLEEELRAQVEAAQAVVRKVRSSSDCMRLKDSCNKEDFLASDLGVPLVPVGGASTCTIGAAPLP